MRKNNRVNVDLNPPCLHEKRRKILSPNNWRENLDPESPVFAFATNENLTCRSLAGPGTGKTFGLMRKIAYLLEEKEINPERILIITFT